MDIQHFDFNVNLLQTILWEYNDAESLISLIKSKQQWYEVNQTEFWNDWYVNVFNVLTANDFGLAVWSMILGLPLFIDPTPDEDGKPIFGFPLLTNSFFNFNQAAFSSKNSSIIVLPTEDKRLIIRLRYFQLTNRCDVLDTNQFLKTVFNDAGYGDVYVLDTLKMEIRYVFTFTPPANLLTVIKTYDLLPRGAGVGIKYIDATRNTFGFGPFYKNFNNGTFNQDL